MYSMNSSYLRYPQNYQTIAQSQYPLAFSFLGGNLNPQLETPVQPLGINQTALLTAQSVPSFQGAANAIKTLPNDTVEIGKNSSEKVNKKKKSSIKKKVILGATGLLLIGFSIYAVKRGNARLKDFRKIFMREDMTKKEAHEIFIRYSDLNKIKDDNEYAKAVFEEAKKNYGLEKSRIKFEIGDTNKSDKYNVGYFDPINNSIKIKPGLSRKDIVDYIHHELRHALQHRYAVSVSDEYAKRIVFSRIRLEARLMPSTGFKSKEAYEKYLEYYDDKIYKELPNGRKNLGTIFDEACRCFDTKTLKPDYSKMKLPEGLVERYRERICGKDFVVPEKYRDFANKCAEGKLNYNSGEGHRLEYFDNFIEKDARNAGFKMKKYLLGGGASFEKAEARLRAAFEKLDTKEKKS